MSNVNREPGQWSAHMQSWNCVACGKPTGRCKCAGGCAQGRADVSALLDGTRGDVTTAELRELVRLAKVGRDALPLCEDVLAVLQNMTSHQFSHGEDRPIRERLAAFIRDARA